MGQGARAVFLEDLALQALPGRQGKGAGLRHAGSEGARDELLANPAASLHRLATPAQSRRAADPPWSARAAPAGDSRVAAATTLPLPTRRSMKPSACRCE